MAKIVLAAFAMTLTALPASAQASRAGLAPQRAAAKAHASRYWMSRDLSHLFGMLKVKF